MKHDSLEFGDLPLLRVECAFAFVQPREISFDVMARLRQAFAAEYPLVENVPSSGSIGFAVISGPPHFRLSNLDHGVYVDLSSAELTSGWTLTPQRPKYVRYPALRAALVKALRHARPDHVAHVRMSYHVQAPLKNGLNAWDYVDPGFLPPVTAGQVPLYDIAFTYGLGSSTSYGLRLNPTMDGAYNIITIGTRPVGTGAPLGTLDQLHGEMQTQFEQLITEAAKTDWKYGSSSL